MFLVATPTELRGALQRLAAHRVLCVDCEGADLSKGSWRNGQLLQDSCVAAHGALCLMQLATTTGEVFVIDVLELGHEAFTAGLGRLLEDPQVLKVVHDFRQDVDALWHQFGVYPRGLFDCQLCDVLLRRLRGRRTIYVQGSARLFEEHGIQAGMIPGYGLLTQELKLKIHGRFSSDRHLWERRPLPEDMIQYAVSDVLPLCRLREALLEQLSAVLGGDRAKAEHLVLVGSAAYDADFASLNSCRCRLCCNAGDNARFDGCRVFTQMAREVDEWTMGPLYRQEDSQPLCEPGPSRFYINEQDESSPLPEAQPAGKGRVHR